MGGRTMKVSKDRAYFLARLAGLALGVNGSGGLVNIVRSKSSVRLFASPAGRRSSLAISAARCAGVSGLVMALWEGCACRNAFYLVGCLETQSHAAGFCVEN